MSLCNWWFPSLLAVATSIIAAPSSAQQAPSGSAAPQAEYVKLRPEQLDELLAPIALYPDALIVQIVTCAASPYQVKQVHEWLQAHADVQGTAIQDAATDEGFDASFVAIVLFPQVVQMMAEQPEWTKNVGEAFSKDRTNVFASIQRLRKQAQEVGNLESNEQQSVESMTTDSGTEVIVIEPANPQIVYVPRYDPEIVYVQQLPTTVVVDDDDGDAFLAGAIGFTAGIFLGAALDDDHYYGCGGWGYHGPCLSDEGWDDFYDHREDMANDFYDHREEMTEKRRQNQGERQDSRTDRQESRGDTQAGRQEGRTDRQDSRPDDRTARQDSRTQNQAGRQDSRTTSRDTSGTRNTSGTTRASNASRGTSTNRAQPATGTNSSAFSGYQKGTNERAASSRGNSSISKSSSSSRSYSAPSRSGSSYSRSGGGSRGGGGRSGGGRR